MASATIRTGGKQYRVAVGDTIRVEKLAGNPGDAVAFNEVLAVEADPPRFGTPLIEGASVAGQIKAQGRGDKLVIFKFRRRKRYRRKNGHRQAYTEVQITNIGD
jgi:large subunit ribosomal protein L21